MAVTKASNSGIKTGVLKYDSMLAGNAAYDPAATWLIQRVAGTGSSGTITFSSIPSTYQHLQIRYIGKSSPTDAAYASNLQVQFNTDTGAGSTNYVRHDLKGNGSSASAAGSTSNSNISLQDAIANSHSTMTNIIGVGIIDIHDYASTTKNKTLRSFYGCDANTASANFQISMTSGLWLQTAAINAITLKLPSGNFTTASTFALYGFKG